MSLLSSNNYYVLSPQWLQMWTAPWGMSPNQTERTLDRTAAVQVHMKDGALLSWLSYWLVYISCWCSNRHPEFETWQNLPCNDSTRPHDTRTNHSESPGWIATQRGAQQGRGGGYNLCRNSDKMGTSPWTMFSSTLALMRLYLLKSKHRAIENVYLRLYLLTSKHRAIENLYFI